MTGTVRRTANPADLRRPWRNLSSRAGRAVQDNRLRRRNTVLRSGIRFDEGQHDALLDELLLAFHSGHRVPESTGHHLTAEVGQQTRICGADMIELFEIAQCGAFGVTRVLQGRRPRCIRGQKRTYPPHPHRAQPDLQFADSALPMPPFRQRLLSATTEIHARSPCACAAAMPTRSSPMTATTAGWPDLAAEITSDTPNTGCASSRLRLWSQTPMAWSRSSSWKSRSRQGGMHVSTWHSGGRTSPRWVVARGADVSPAAILMGPKFGARREQRSPSQG